MPTRECDATILVVSEETEAGNSGGLAADAGGAALEGLGRVELYLLDALSRGLEGNLIGDFLGLLLATVDDGSQGEEGRGTTRAETLAHGAGILLLRRHGGC